MSYRGSSTSVDYHNEATVAATHTLAETGILVTQTQSHAASIHKLLYSNWTLTISCDILHPIGEGKGAGSVHSAVRGALRLTQFFTRCTKTK